MDNLAFARAQMGLSLAFHIVFAVIGIGVPVLMVTARRPDGSAPGTPSTSRSRASGMGPPASDSRRHLADYIEFVARLATVDGALIVDDELAPHYFRSNLPTDEGDEFIAEGRLVYSACHTSGSTDGGYLVGRDDIRLCDPTS